jgi:UDP-N-acetylmuramoyl-tripeptide--D-alanyl-D-alanine ligase
MEPSTVAEIASLASGSLFGSGSGVVTAVSTDTRSIQPGQLFVALRGERFDAHDFLATAFEQGAAAALVERVNLELPELPQIEVPNSLAGLQTLARNYRRKFQIPVVGITGSNGKTSTKEMVAAVLSERFQVTKTSGNLNNHIGVPLSVLRFERQHQVAVIEYGTNHPGEIAGLVAIASPQYAIVTNIGVAHIEFLGSPEGIAREKSVLAESVSEEGTVVLNASDDFADWIAGRCRAKVVTVGSEKGQVRVQQQHYSVDFLSEEKRRACSCRNRKRKRRF